MRVVIADDHPLWRETLRGLLDESGKMTVVGEAGDGDAVVDVTARTRPDVVVMDIDMPGASGVAATLRIREAQPEVRVLVLSAAKERQAVMAAVRAGASGYLVKTAEPTEIIDALRRIHAGEIVFPAELSDIVLGQLRGVHTRGARVAVVATRALDREGIAHLLAQSGREVVAKGAAPDAVAEADVVVLVTRRARADEITRLLGNRTANDRPGVLVLCDTVDDSTVAGLMSGERGVGCVLRENLDVDALVDAVDRVGRGDNVLDRSVAARLVDRKDAADRPGLAELTGRERSVLALMAEGRSNSAIASHLHLGVKTVEGHVASIFTKLGLAPTAEDHRRVMAVVRYLQAED